MQHQEIKRIIPCAKTAVLFIHGIIGSPNQFDFLIPAIPPNVSFYNILLDGHGKGVKDFSKTSMSKWEKQIAAAIDELTISHSEVLIVAHSMGCLFAIEQAICNPGITKLILLAAPIKLFLKPSILNNARKGYKGNPKPNDPIGKAACKCCSITHSKNLFAYLGWLPRYFELFSKIRHTRNILPKLSTPTLAFQSAKDEMVAASAGKLLSENPKVSVTMLERSRHFYYEPEEQVQLRTAFSRWLDVPLPQKERAYAYLRSIPKGKVVTYKQVALHLGNVKLARHVGNLLHQNPDGDHTPCYKVVSAEGKLADHYAFGGAEAQKARLESEGIEVHNGKVNLKKYQYDTEEKL